MDSDQSVQSPAPRWSTEGSDQAFQGEPVVGKVPLFCAPDGAVPIGQYQPDSAYLDAVNQSMQQVRITSMYYTKAQ